MHIGILPFKGMIGMYALVILSEMDSNNALLSVAKRDPYFQRVSI